MSLVHADGMSPSIESGAHALTQHELFRVAIMRLKADVREALRQAAMAAREERKLYRKRASKMS